MEDELNIELDDSDFSPREDMPEPSFSKYDDNTHSIIANKGTQISIDHDNVQISDIITKKEIYESCLKSLYNDILTRKDDNGKPVKRIIPSDIELISNFILKYYTIITAFETDCIFIYEDTKGIFIEGGEVVLKKDVEKYLQQFCKTEVVNEILNKVRRKTYQSVNVFVENNKDFICLENGVWCFSQHKLLSHSPDYKFMNAIPIVYNPEAQCNKIAKFFEEIVYKDKVKLLYELFGFCLIPEYKIQKAIMLIGSGRNGKSVYLNLLRTFLGKQNVSTQSIQRLSVDKFSSFQLFGKIANIFPDLSSEEIGDSSTFKTLTSGLDPLSAEQKFKNSFVFINHAKLLFSCNQIPKSKDDSDAFFRRWVIIVFPFIFDGANDNKELINDLTTPEELSGLFNIAIEYSYRLMSEGEFTSAQTTDEIREIYTRLSDSVGSFILDKIDICGEDFIQKDVLYADFVNYCRNFKFPVMSEKMFSSLIFQRLPVTNFRPVLEGGIRPMCWKGIGWKQLDEEIPITKERM